MLITYTFKNWHLSELLSPRKSGPSYRRYTDTGTYSIFNPLKPNSHYSGRAASPLILASKGYLLTNILTEYFKHVA
jgi:hypothetical protein